MTKRYFFLVFLIASMQQHASPMADEGQHREIRGLAAWHEVIIGTFAGIAEVAPVGNALNVIKTHLQLNEPWWHRNPFHYTRGMAANILGSAPITALQFGIKKGLADILSEQGTKPLSPAKEMFTGFSAGALAGVVACPMDYVATQQRTGDRLVSTIQRLMVGKHMVWHGYVPVAMRDGIFSAGFMVFAPYLKKKLQERGLGSVSASLAAGGFAGVATALASHPMDVVRAQLHGQYSSNVAEAIKALYREGGVISYFRGAAPRSIRVIWAVTALGGISDWLRENRITEQAVDQLSDLFKKIRL